MIMGGGTDSIHMLLQLQLVQRVGWNSRSNIHTLPWQPICKLETEHGKGKHTSRPGGVGQDHVHHPFV